MAVLPRYYAMRRHLHFWTVSQLVETELLDGLCRGFESHRSDGMSYSLYDIPPWSALRRKAVVKGVSDAPGRYFHRENHVSFGFGYSLEVKNVRAGVMRFSFSDGYAVAE